MNSLSNHVWIWIAGLIAAVLSLVGGYFVLPKLMKGARKLGPGVVLTLALVACCVAVAVLSRRYPASGFAESSLPALFRQSYWAWMLTFWVGLLVSGFVLVRTLLRRTRSARVKDAALLSLVVSEGSDLYSVEVVDRLPPDVAVSHDYTARKGTIPLPPTMTLLLARRISEKGAGEVRLYSDYPFPSRQNPPMLASFEQDALRALRQRPGEPYYRFEEWQGRPALRYATANVMGRRCVNCHNAHKDSPKRDWREGDVRGVLEVILPLD